MRPLTTAAISAAAFSATVFPATAGAQLRLATWNITNYAGGRDSAVQTTVYDTYNGQQMAPDILAMQEMIGAGSLSSLVNILNAAPGSPGDWASAPYVESADTERAFLYRTGKVVWVATTVVAQGSGSANPRDIMRYDFRPAGYSGVVSLYNVHMKAGSTSGDQDRRLIEAQLIRDNAETLPVARPFILCGDLNIQSSQQAAYLELIGIQTNENGRLFDTILTPGDWNNSSSFRFVHTQDPESFNGGMDDRFDQILINDNVFDGVGFEYLGAAFTRYSTTTWDDPNHSYRAWGNDGTSFNQGLRVAGNTFVGPTIAQAIIDSCGGQSGHIPVYADFVVPPVIGVNGPVIDLGAVPAGQTVQAQVLVTNTGDTNLWTAAGISDLNYSFNAISPQLTPPAGPFAEPAGGGGAAHDVDVAVPLAEGAFAFQLQVVSDSEGLNINAAPLIFIIGNAVAVNTCTPDVTTTNSNPGDAGYGEPDGVVDGADLSYFIEFWLGGIAAVADVTTINTNPGDPGYGEPDGLVDGADLSYYVEAWLAGCP